MEASPAHVTNYYFSGLKRNRVPLFQRPDTWSRKQWRTHRSVALMALLLAVGSASYGQINLQLQPIKLYRSSPVFGLPSPCRASNTDPQTTATGLSFTVQVSCTTGDSATGSFQFSVSPTTVNGKSFTTPGGDPGIMLSGAVTAKIQGSVTFSGPNSSKGVVDLILQNNFTLSQETKRCEEGKLSLSCDLPPRLCALLRIRQAKTFR